MFLFLQTIFNNEFLFYFLFFYLKMFYNMYYTNIVICKK